MIDVPGQKGRTKKCLLRIAVALGLLITVFYGLILGYFRWNENSSAFPGADLDGEDRLVISGRISVPFDTTRVTTYDGVSILLLESRLVEAPEAPWIIYFYGQRGRVADGKGCAMYDLFRSVGLNVLAIDYRGYGASEKRQPTEKGIYSDARAAWQYLAENRGVPASRVVLYGYSLGGAVAIQLATEKSPAGLITEGAFTSIPAWVRFHNPWIPIPAFSIRNRFENLEKAKSVPVPWLLFHGSKDCTTPFSHAVELAGTTAGVRRLVPLDCGHGDALEVEAERMERALKEFVGGLFGLEYPKAISMATRVF